MKTKTKTKKKNKPSQESVALSYLKIRLGNLEQNYSQDTYQLKKRVQELEDRLRAKDTPAGPQPPQPQPTPIELARKGAGWDNLYLWDEVKWNSSNRGDDVREIRGVRWDEYSGSYEYQVAKKDGQFSEWARGKNLTLVKRNYRDPKYTHEAMQAAYKTFTTGW